MRFINTTLWCCACYLPGEHKKVFFWWTYQNEVLLNKKMHTRIFSRSKLIQTGRKSKNTFWKLKIISLQVFNSSKVFAPWTHFFSKSAFYFVFCNDYFTMISINIFLIIFLSRYLYFSPFLKWRFQLWNLWEFLYDGYSIYCCEIFAQMSWFFRNSMNESVESQYYF